MKNIHVLEINQPSRLVKDLNGVFSLMGESIKVGGPIRNINIYITSDEEIKEGDWCIDTFKNGKIIDVFKCTEEQLLNIQIGTDTLNYKIIFSTDPKLIADGIQAIDDTFLKWFIQNTTCEFVDVYQNKKDFGTFQWYSEYKIKIPREEPKQKTRVFGTKDDKSFWSDKPIQERHPDKQETLEESNEDTAIRFLEWYRRKGVVRQFHAYHIPGNDETIYLSAQQLFAIFKKENYE